LDNLADAGFTSERTRAVRFCMGGSVSFLAATLRPIGAAATFYGGGVREGRFGLISTSGPSRRAAQHDDPSKISQANPKAEE
jgi:dienelactone hydrolase